jgi:hypothetical protein
MTLAATPHCRLVPCMPSQPCVQWTRRLINSTQPGLPQSRIKDNLYNCSTRPRTRNRDVAPEDCLLNSEAAFNIHNPSSTHRVR